jgi:hypothetical protein
MSAREYLVHHGCAGHLGRFRTAADGALDRGAAVVVRTLRGLELGEVLCPADSDRLALPDPFVGELLRAATPADLDAADRARQLGQRLFDEGSRLTEALALPLAPVDVEVLLDGRQALLHAIRLGPCDEGPLLATLGERHDLVMRFYDLTQEPAAVDGHEDHGCGSCGSGGCGADGCGSCGTGGGCGSCSAGGAKELAAYFAGLREQMENRQRVPLL